MTIEILKKGNNLMCNIEGQGEKAVLELYMAVGMLSTDKLKATLGAEMPEIVCKCEISEAEQKLINQIKDALEGKYQ
ncbi:MAG: hypothetical protein IJN15_04425 [Clostridia bacterium]|nr:hypothetical protein [Clostridia bacterium]